MFKDRLRSARISRGKTLQETADAVGVGIVTIQNYESGNREPNLQMLTQLADFLSISVDFLLCRDDFLSSLGVSFDVPREGPPRRPKPQKNHFVSHTQSSDIEQ